MSASSEALTFFLDDARMAAVEADPDTGFDLVEDLTADDWRALAGEYRARGAEWRRSALYLAGARPLGDSGLLIRHGLRDQDVTTLETALLAVSASIEEAGSALSPADARLVLDAIPRLPEDAQRWEEIVELKDLASLTV